MCGSAVTRPDAYCCASVGSSQLMVARGEALSRYTWVITLEIVPFKSTSQVFKKGPSGTTDRAPLSVVIRHGERFRMHRGEGESLISGYIVGKYTSLEPLEDYGRALSCTTIEYERGGVWMKLDLFGTTSKTG